MFSCHKTLHKELGIVSDYSEKVWIDKLFCHWPSCKFKSYHFMAFNNRLITDKFLYMVAYNSKIVNLYNLFICNNLIQVCWSILSKFYKLFEKKTFFLFYSYFRFG